MQKEENTSGLPEGWEEMISEDYCFKVADGTHDSPKKSIGGKYLVTSKNIKNSKLDLSSSYKISNSDYDFINKRSKVDKWDVLLGMIGTVGEVCLIDKTPEFAIKNIGLFKCGNEFNAKWLYYYLKSSIGKNYILSRLSGTTQKYISLGELRKLPIRFPKNQEILKSIAKILSSFDDKIELLREQNETLEKMGQEIFREWFGKYKVGDELPEGWKVEKLENLVETIIDYRGKTPKKLGLNWSEVGIPAISAKSIKNGCLVREDAMNYGDEELYNIWMKEKLEIGDILMTSEAPLGEMYYLSHETKYILSQRVFALRANKAITSEYLFYYLFSVNGQYLLNSRASGSTVVGIRQSELRKIDVIVPNSETLNKISSVLGTYILKKAQNEIQISNLSKTRDSLLPKLMKGEIIVGNLKD